MLHSLPRLKEVAIPTSILPLSSFNFPFRVKAGRIALAVAVERMVVSVSVPQKHTALS